MGSMTIQDLGALKAPKGLCSRECRTIKTSLLIPPVYLILLNGTEALGVSCFSGPPVRLTSTARSVLTALVGEVGLCMPVDTEALVASRSVPTTITQVPIVLVVVWVDIMPQGLVIPLTVEVVVEVVPEVIPDHIPEPELPAPLL